MSSATTLFAFLISFATILMMGHCLICTRGLEIFSSPDFPIFSIPFAQEECNAETSCLSGSADATFNGQAASVEVRSCVPSGLCDQVCSTIFENIAASHPDIVPVDADISIGECSYTCCNEDDCNS